MYGRQFQHRSLLMQLTAVGGLMVALHTPSAHLISACERFWTSAMMCVCWGFVLIGTAAYLLKNGMGAEGVAWAYLAAYVVQTICMSSYAVTLLGWRPLSNVRPPKRA